MGIERPKVIMARHRWLAMIEDPVPLTHEPGGTLELAIIMIYRQIITCWCEV
jgi:hypothetical protein